MMTTNLGRSVGFALLVAWCLAMAERPAHAYLDPGSGSMLLQVLLGGFAGLAVIGKLYWRRLATLLGFRSKSQDE